MERTVAHLTITDSVIWTKHIAGDPRLRDRLSLLPAGEVVHLMIDGLPFDAEKMRDGSDGRPTLGLRPIGPAKDWWQRQWQARKGDVVSFEFLAPDRGGSVPLTGARRANAAGVARIAEELAGIAPTGIDSVALLDAARGERPR